MAYHISFNQNTPNQFKEQIANSDYTGFQLIKGLFFFYIVGGLRSYISRFPKHPS